MVKEDFIGFSFNGHHSSDLSIKRVSDGSRYNNNLTPTFQDKTLQIPGGDGTYFFDTFDTMMPLPVSVAFDELTEIGFRTLREVFNSKAQGWLIFDETPYKQYYVKIQNVPQFKFICFDTPSGERVYKGEGTLQFVAYEPYAHSVSKYLNQFSDTNKSQWAASSRMKASQGSYDGMQTTSVLLYNAGDLDTNLKIYVTNDATVATTLTLTRSDGVTLSSLKLSPFTRQSGDKGVCINSKTHLIEGHGNSLVLTQNLYNQYLIAGDFFKLPASTYDYTLTISGGTGVIEKVEYEYLYY